MVGSRSNLAPRITSEVKVEIQKEISTPLLLVAILQDIAEKKGVIPKNEVIDFGTNGANEQVVSALEKTLPLLPRLIKLARQPWQDRRSMVGIVGLPGAGKSTIGKEIATQLDYVHFTEKSDIMGDLTFDVPYDPNNRNEQPFELEIVVSWLINRFQGTAHGTRVIEDKCKTKIDISIGMDWFQFLVTIAAYLDMNHQPKSLDDFPWENYGLQSMEELWYLLPLLANKPDIVFFLDAEESELKERVRLQAQDNPGELLRRRMALKHIGELRSQTMVALERMNHIAARFGISPVPVYYCPTGQTAEYNLSRALGLGFEVVNTGGIVAIVKNKFNLSWNPASKEAEWERTLARLEQVAVEYPD